MLNFDKIKNIYPQNSIGGECVIFCRKILLDLPYGLTSKSKKSNVLMKSNGYIPKEEYIPQLGDMIVTNEGEWGHVAIINEILDKDIVKVSESNYHLDKKIDHNRVVNLNKTKLAYIWRSELNIMNKNLQRKWQAILLQLGDIYDYVAEKKLSYLHLELAHNSANEIRKLLNN